jgi:hypothetical protein
MVFRRAASRKRPRSKAKWTGVADSAYAALRYRQEPPDGDEDPA